MGVDEALGFGEEDGETPGVSDGLGVDLGVDLGVGVGFGLFDGVGDFVGNGASVGVIPLELRAFGEKRISLVKRSTAPSAAIPFTVWNSITALYVAEPK